MNTRKLNKTLVADQFDRIQSNLELERTEEEAVVPLRSQHGFLAAPPTSAEHARAASRAPSRAPSGWAQLEALGAARLSPEQEHAYSEPGHEALRDRHKSLNA